ncbi:type IV pilin N-terminal domain-containing protein [uncultured Methanocorpusculum sp.]|nr:type IV pilin N-terminal domain-containing protein [uncultured Methanocorpusculum sp.]
MTDDAVSEVVGVMIMLVVTILLVSIVRASASGLIGDSKTPISAELVFVEDSGNNLIFEHRAGDPLTLSSLKLVLGVRDNMTRNIPLNASSFTSTGGNAVQVADRILISFDMSAFASPGEYITYQFYDIESQSLISSGEIQV